MIYTYLHFTYGKLKHKYLLLCKCMGEEWGPMGAYGGEMLHQ